MQTTIDKAGRLVLPKSARERLGLKPGDALDLEPTPDGIHLRPARAIERLVYEGGVLVFTGEFADRATAEKDYVQADREERIATLVRQAMTDEDAL